MINYSSSRRTKANFGAHLNKRLYLNRALWRPTVLGNTLLWPTIFLAILLYSTIGPILSNAGLLNQNFKIYSPEYTTSATLYFVCGYFIFLLGYYSSWSRQISYRIPKYVLNPDSVAMLGLVLWMIILLSFFYFIWATWPLSNLWNSSIPRGYGQFDDTCTVSQNLNLASYFLLPVATFISGLLYNDFPNFRRIAFATFGLAALFLMVNQGRDLPIELIIAFALGRYLSGKQESSWRRWFKLIISGLLCLIIFNIIGYARHFAGRTGIYNTYIGIVTYFSIPQKHETLSLNFFPESGDLHYITKIMELNAQGSYMSKAEYLCYFDPLPSFIGKSFYWPKKADSSWFTKAIGCYGSAGAPLPFGSGAYAALGFAGCLLFMPFGFLFRVVQIQLANWLRKKPKERYLDIITPLFAVILVLATLSGFTHGGIRTVSRMIINLIVILMGLVALGVLRVEKKSRGITHNKRIQRRLA